MYKENKNIFHLELKDAFDALNYNFLLNNKKLHWMHKIINH